MKNDRGTLMSLSEELLAYGKSKGATQMEISISDGSEFSVDVREGEIERLVEAGPDGRHEDGLGAPLRDVDELGATEEHP